MIPRTPLQKEVAKVMHKMQGLTPRQIEWVRKRCFVPKAYTCKSKAWCSECGHEWAENVGDKTHTLCPFCGAKLEVKKRARTKFHFEENGFNIITTCNGWQVIRALEVHKRIAKGKEAEFSWCDVCQNWIHPSGKDVIVAKKIVGMGWNRKYGWGTETEIRQGSARGNEYTRVLNFELQYPRFVLLPEIKRNGYDRRRCKRFAEFDVFKTLLENPMAETLLKAGQMSAFKYSLIYPKSIAERWSQLKICMRNGYIVEDYTLWRDYIVNLEEFGKDTRNAHYVCPKDLRKAHDVYMEKKRKKEAEERKRKLREEIAEAEIDYRKRRQRFFGIAIKVDDIDISVIKSVSDVFDEGEAMHHCVFTNGYYKDKDSVLLSARRNGERVETVEYSLKKRRVVQSRGVCNKNTEFHDLIVNAVNSNSHLFKRARVS